MTSWSGRSGFSYLVQGLPLHSYMLLNCFIFCYRTQTPDMARAKPPQLVDKGCHLWPIPNSQTHSKQIAQFVIAATECTRTMTQEPRSSKMWLRMSSRSPAGTHSLILPRSWKRLPAVMTTLCPGSCTLMWTSIQVGTFAVNAAIDTKP